MKESRRKEIIAYTNCLIDGVMEFYVRGEAVDCDETRKNINRELDSVLPRVEERFGLRKIPKVLRARSRGDGMFVVRMEDKHLN